MTCFLKALSLSLLASIVLVSCSSAPRYRTHSAEPARSTGDKRREAVNIALSYLGTPYRTGGSTKSGVDCSGLIQAVYAQLGVRLPRTSLDQSRVGKRISRPELEPGDLVFFATSRTRSVSHVGIYIGRGRFVHASTRARKVRIDELRNPYFRKRFVLARRVL